MHGDGGVSGLGSVRAKRESAAQSVRADLTPVSRADQANLDGKIFAGLPEHPTKDVLVEKCEPCDTIVGASPACSLLDMMQTLAPSTRASQREESTGTRERRTWDRSRAGRFGSGIAKPGGRRE